MFMTILPFSLAILSWALISPVNGQGNTTCQGTGLDWYTDVVGETPCQTYQRLRQICVPEYEVGTQNVNTPPDNCSDQLASCCCNSISFSLSMLCLNCQQKIGSGTGFDAGAGAYQMYLTRSDGTQCSPNVNESLPTDIQSAVCNTQIKLENALYGLFWGDGSWFYEYTKETISKDNLANNNNTFTHCASTTLSNTTSSAHSSAAPATSTRSSSASSSGTGVTQQNQNDTSSSAFSHPGPIAGVVVGIVAFIAIVIGLLWFWRRRRRLSQTHARHIEADLGGGDEPRFAGGPGMLEATPYITERLPPPSMPRSKSDTMTLSTTSGITSSGMASSSSGSRGRSDSSTQNPSTIASASSPSHVRLESVPSELSIPLLGARTVSDEKSSMRPSTATRRLPSPPVEPIHERLPERHLDAGPIEGAALGRSPSGRLPPAYGEQL